jgi:ribosomal protein S27E
MERMPKKAVWVLLEDQVVVECPYCGRTLLTAKYGRMEKLLNYQGPVPAKICKKCSKVVLLQVGSKIREQIQAKIDGLALPSKLGSRTA